MSEFSLLCANTALWEPTTRATWGSHDFWLVITQFEVCTIMQAQLTVLSQAGAWGKVEKSQWDMAYLMIAPSINAEGDQVFGLAVVWVHPCQGCLSTLVEAAWKLMLLVDNSPDWPYAFICMNDTMLHVPLSDKGYICTMTDGVCSTNTWSWLHQLQAWKLLQHGDSMVFQAGLNGEPRALQFSFQELPLWNATTVDGPTQDPPLIEVVLGGTEPKTANTIQVPPPSSHQTSAWHCCSSQPTPPGGLGTAGADFSHNLSPHLSA